MGACCGTPKRVVVVGGIEDFDASQARKAREAADAARRAREAEEAQALLARASALAADQAGEQRRLLALAGAVFQAREAAVAAERAAEAAEAAAAASAQLAAAPPLCAKYAEHAAMVDSYNRMYARVRSRRAPFMGPSAAEREAAAEAAAAEDEAAAGAKARAAEVRAEAEAEAAAAAGARQLVKFDASNILTIDLCRLGASVQPGPDWDTAHFRVPQVEGGAAQLLGTLVGWRGLGGGGARAGDAPSAAGEVKVEWGPEAGIATEVGGAALCYAAGRGGRFELSLLSKVGGGSLKQPAAACSLGALAGILSKSASHAAKARGQGAPSAPEAAAPVPAASRRLSLPAAPSAPTLPPPPVQCKFLSHCMNRHCCSAHHGVQETCYCPDLECDRGHPNRCPFDDGTLQAEAAMLVGRGLDSEVQPLPLAEFEQGWGVALAALALGQGKACAAVVRLDFGARRLCEASRGRVLEALHAAGDTGRAALQRGVHSTKRSRVALKELLLADAGLGELGCAVLANALLDLPTLERLGLAKNNMGERSCGLLANALSNVHGNAAAFCEPAHLLELNLGANNVTALGARHIAEYLERPECRLTALDLRYNQLGAVGGAHIARALANVCPLKKLNLYQNHIADEGANNVAEALRVNATLEWLDLGLNDFGDSAAFNLGTMLRGNNATLAFLDLRNNPIGHLGENALVRGLEKNAFLKKLHMGAAGAGEHEMRIKVGWPRIGIR